MAVKSSDLNLLANDSFESMRIQFTSEEDFINKLKHYTAEYLQTGNDFGLTQEHKRLVDSLIHYVKYQLETRTQSVSTSHTTSPPTSR